MVTPTVEKPGEHLPAQLVELSSRLHDLADELQTDVENDDYRTTLSTAQQMRRSLTLLEYELIDGEHCGRGDCV